MNRGVKISKGKELTKNKKLVFFNRPKYVYIPLIDDNITIVVKKGDYVYKGSIIAKKRGELKLPIHSSISGTVVGFEDKYCSSGHLVKCVVIENDFKEKIEYKQVVREKINDFTKDKFVKVLQDCGIVGLGGSGFPTYIKYKNIKDIDTLIVNAVECEPYITADNILIKEKAEEILEAIDAMMEINGIKEGIIALKKDSKVMKNFYNYIGTYPHIKIVTVPDLYPNGWEKKLVEIVKGIKSGESLSEQNIMVDNVSTIYSIYKALQCNKPLIERIVTFTGDMFKKPQNVYVKVGTSVREVIEQIDGFKRNKNLYLIAGGPMMGISIPSDDFIITADVNCVLALKEGKPEEVLNCMRCGKCVDNCPSKLSPVLIKDNLKNQENLKNLNVDKCIECGLCSYVCPSKINIRGCVITAKDILKQERGE